MKIFGINHINLSVSDLSVSFRFYSELLGFRPLARWDYGAYFRAGTAWICLTADPNVRTGALPEYSHIAFSVEEGDYEDMSDRIIRSGAEQWQKNRSEGKSLYFLDPDGHKLEIHAGDVKSRLDACRKDPFTGMVLFD